MTQSKINFFNENSTYIIKRKKLIKSVLSSICFNENIKLKELNIIACNDNYLLKLNKSFLNHNTFTDVIAFNNSEAEDEIYADIFLSEERAGENAKKFGNKKEDEINRLMIHAVLHLCGYKDKSEKQKLNMRKIEDKYLSLLAK